MDITPLTARYGSTASTRLRMALHGPQLGQAYAQNQCRCFRHDAASYAHSPALPAGSQLHNETVQTWQSEWDASNKGELTKTFFPIVKDGISKRLQMCINFSTIITGHGKLRAYFHRFKMIDDPTCLCKMSPQTTDHLLWECELLKKQRQVLRNISKEDVPT